MSEDADEPTRPSSPATARQVLEEIRTAELDDIQKTPERKQEQLRGLESYVNRTFNNPTHVLPELLQNADDIGDACEAVTIELTDDTLVFQNHGGPMTADNVEALGAYTETTKRGDLDTIGHFGIGFKSVFALTKTPYIHSGYFSFRYDDDAPTIPQPVDYLEQPVATEPEVDGTRIVLPFSNEDPTRLDLLKTQLNRIQTLLPFLNHITSVTVSIFGDERTYHRESRGNEEFVIRGPENEQRFRLFSKPFTPDEHLLQKLEEDRGVRGLDERSVSLDVTIAIELNDAGEPIETNPSHLFCYFPTAPDTHLPFDIQADFSLRPDREDILWPDEFNEALLSHVPAVFEKAFRTLQAEGVDPSKLLTLIPDPDYDRENSHGIDDLTESILEFVRAYPCVPDADGDLFAPRDAVLIDESFRQLLSGETLTALLDREVRYPATSLSSTAYDRLRATVPENELSVVELLEATAECTLFSERPNAWLTQFMAGVMREWNAAYSGSWTHELQERRDQFLAALKQAPLLPVQGGECVAYEAVDGQLNRLGPTQTDDYQLFTDSPRLILLDEEFLSLLYEPPAEIETAASLASSLLFDDNQLLAIETLDSEQVVREIINPEFAEGTLSQERADKLLLFIARRPKSLPDIAKVKLQSRGGAFVEPDALFLGDAYIDAYDSETVFSVFEDCSPISDHYLELGDLSEDEWIQALTALGVHQRIEVETQDVWDSDRFVSQADARAFLDEHGDEGQTKLHDERSLRQYNGRDETWMKKPHPNSRNKNYRYAFIDRSLPEATENVLSRVAGDGEDPADVSYWRAFLEMFEAEWEAYYAETIHRTYRYSEYSSKFRVRTGDCYCPSSFGTFLREHAWVPGNDDELSRPQNLFVRNEQTTSKPVTFVEPEPRPAGLREFLGFQTTPGIQVTIHALQSKLDSVTDDDEFDPEAFARELRKDLVPIEEQLLEDGEVMDMEARDRLAETPFIFVSNATPAFRLPTQVTWDGQRLGQYRVPVSDIYTDFEQLFRVLGVKPEPTWDDCLAFLDSTEVVSRTSPEEPIGAPWGQVDEAWRIVLRETVYLAPEDRQDGDPLPLGNQVGRLPTAAETLADSSTVRYHTTNRTLLQNLPSEITSQVLYSFRDNRYTDPEYTDRIEQLTGTKPLEQNLERRLSTEPAPENAIGTLEETYGELLAAGYSYLSGEEEEAPDPEPIQEFAEFAVFEVEGLACEYRVNGTLVDQPIDCFLDQDHDRIVISTDGKAAFALIDVLASEIAVEPAQRTAVTSLLKGAYGKSDAIFREFLADSGYPLVEVPVVEAEEDASAAETEDDDSAAAEVTGADATVDEAPADNSESVAATQTTGASEGTMEPEPTPTEPAVNGSSAETMETVTAPAVDSASGDPTDETARSPVEPTSQSTASSSHRESSASSDSTDRAAETESTPTRSVPSSTDSQPIPDRLQSDEDEPVSSQIDTGPVSSPDEVDVTDSGSDNGDPRANSRNGGGGGGGAHLKQIGDTGERFVFDELVAAVEAYFECQGTLLEPFGDGKDANCRGKIEGEVHRVTVADVSHDQIGYDLLLEGAQLASTTDGFSIETIGDGLQNHVEVKSSKSTTTKFTVSPNEYQVALENPASYAIVRVHTALDDPVVDRLFHDIPNLDLQTDGVWYLAHGVVIDY